MDGLSRKSPLAVPGWRSSNRDGKYSARIGWASNLIGQLDRWRLTKVTRERLLMYAPGADLIRNYLK